MIIIPAIDIIEGKVVRLQQGDFNKEKIYSDDPASVANLWQKKGASFLHLVDLDGARLGQVKNADVISRIIKKVDVPCEVGGGLRDESDIRYFLRQGAHRVVLGTRAIEDTGYVERLIARFSEKIAISIDFSGKNVVKKGWQEETGVTPEVLAGRMEEAGVKTLVVTDTAKDGTMSGPDIGRIEEILGSVKISVIVSGGISGVDDIKKLKELGRKNLTGVIIGRALYEGKIDFEEAVRIAV